MTDSSLVSSYKEKDLWAITAFLNFSDLYPKSDEEIQEIFSLVIAQAVPLIEKIVGCKIKLFSQEAKDHCYGPGNEETNYGEILMWFIKDHHSGATRFFTAKEFREVSGGIFKILDEQFVWREFTLSTGKIVSFIGAGIRQVPGGYGVITHFLDTGIF